MFRRSLMAMGKNFTGRDLRKNPQVISRSFSLIYGENKYRNEFFKYLQSEEQNKNSRLEDFKSKILSAMDQKERSSLVLELILKECGAIKFEKSHPLAEEFRRIESEEWCFTTAIQAFEIIKAIEQSKHNGVVVPSEFLDKIHSYLVDAVKHKLVDIANKKESIEDSKLPLLYWIGKHYFPRNGDSQVSQLIDDIAKKEIEKVNNNAPKYISTSLKINIDSQGQIHDKLVIPKILSTLSILKESGCFEKYLSEIELRLLSILARLSIESQLQILSSIALNSNLWSDRFVVEAEKNLAYTLDNEMDTVDISSLLRFLSNNDRRFRGKFAFKVREAIQGQLDTVSPNTCLLILGYLHRQDIDDKDLIDFCEDKLKNNAGHLVKSPENAVLLSILAAESSLVSLEFKETIREWIKRFDWKHFDSAILLRFYISRLIDREYKELDVIAEHLKSQDGFLDSELTIKFVQAVDSLWNQDAINKDEVEKYLKFLFDKVIKQITEKKIYNKEESKYFLDVIAQTTNSYDNLKLD